MVPCSMFIPQANTMSPDLAGVNSITKAHSAEGSFDVQRRKSHLRAARLVGCAHERDARPYAGAYRHSRGLIACSFTTTLAVWAVSPSRPALDDAGGPLVLAPVLGAGLSPSRSRSALTKKLPS